MDLSIILNNGDYLAKGLRYTVELTAIAFTGGAAFGLLLALCRLSRFRLVSSLAGLYVDLIRSIPLLLVLFWVFFLFPMMLQGLIGAPRPVKVGPERTAIITFILFEAAYFCEIIRSGIQSLHKGQWSAALALGLTPVQRMFYVILPQALRNMAPVLLTQLIVLFQDTSLVYVISGTDFLGAASKIGQRDGDLVIPYLFVALVYLIVSIVLSSLVRYLGKGTRQTALQV
ncbi:MAG: amino acid ABC transporter permease [Burkholderiaceae bacterium]|nr:amino acid ABC transporter permease [Burkholderiaceae bacterium]